jgi:ferrous iron transport protein A
MVNVTALNTLRPGETGQVHELAGGRGFVGRLAALGFTPGARIRMMQNFGHGPLIVLVRDTRLALGRGEAMKVLVEKVSEAANQQISNGTMTHVR